MGFLDVGALELLVILMVALLLFGPNKLPEIGRNLGKAVNKFRSALNQSTSEVKQEGEDVTTEVRKAKAELQKARRELSKDLQGIGAEEGTAEPSSLRTHEQAERHSEQRRDRR